MASCGSTNTSVQRVLNVVRVGTRDRCFLISIVLIGDELSYVQREEKSFILLKIRYPQANSSQNLHNHCF